MNFFSIACSTAAFLAAIWIIIPAPADFIWPLAVAASEWSVWIGFLAIVGLVASSIIIVLYGISPLPIVSGVFCITALLLSLYPPLSVIPLARETKTSLSLSRYFSGAFPEYDSAKTFSTHTFFVLEGKTLNADVYLPAKESQTNGASIIVVHGGSWNGGARNDFPHWNALFAKQGYTVFDIDYSLEPQPNYLEATADVKCAVQWVKTNATKFDIDPNRIVLMGRSAGAHLALLAAYTAGDTRLPSSCPNDAADEKVSAVISFYAPIDLFWAYNNPANQWVINGPLTLANFLGGSPHESDEIRDRFIMASPITHVSTKTPPTLLIHGGRDQLVRHENMQFLNEKLTKANVPHRTISIPYAQHGFDYNSNGWGSQITESVLLEFLRVNTKPQ